MNITKITFGGAYKIKCKSAEQAQKIKEALPKNVSFAQKGSDIIVVENFDNNKKIVMECLEKNTDAHDRNMHNTAIASYRKTGIEPGQIVDTYR